MMPQVHTSVRKDLCPDGLDKAGFAWDAGFIGAFRGLGC